MGELSILREALQHFRELRFPGKCRGKNVYGIELILLDADIYHAVEKIADGDRDPEVLNLLGSLELHARMVLHALENDAYYYDQAQELARMALDSVPVERGPVVRLVEAVIADDSPDLDLIASYRDVINARAFSHDTALITAVRLGREVWCRALLASGADPLVEDGVGGTAFMVAVLSGQAGMLQRLVDAGIDPIKQYYHDVPALWWAISYEHESVVAFLLERGANSWVKNDWGVDPYEFAVNNGLVSIAELIAKARGEEQINRSEGKSI